MNYYVISPNVWNNGEDYSKEMRKNQIAAVGWTKDSTKGNQFKKIKKGDCIIVAKRNDWQWIYYFLGIVEGDENKAPIGTLAKKLSSIIDLSDSDLNFDNWSANGSTQIPSPQRIMKENQSIIAMIDRKIEEAKMKEQLEKYKNLLEHTHNLILHGAPGTGKTHLAREIAAEMKAEVGFVQFHPSYDYTDFVEGLRPMNDAGSGQIGFERKDGVFKKFCERALENMNGFSEDNFAEAYKKLLDKVEEAEESETPYILKTLSHKKEFALKTNSLQNFYAVPQTDKKTHMPITKDSIRTYLRTGEISDWKPYLTAIAQHLIDDFGYKKQAQNTENKNFVFIIDEINRGEMSKIFGELFFAIEPSYRGAEKCKDLRTQYANLQTIPNLFDVALGIKDSDNFGHFFVPENVYIIGTMNDIDRNVESMDFAFRRRFTFKEIKAKDTQDMLDKDEAWENQSGETVKPDEQTIQEIKNRMDSLNKAIDSIEGLSSAYHIGGAYFLKLKDLNNDFDLLWEYHLEGLLREYLRGMEDSESKLAELRKAYENKAVANQDESSNGQEQ